MNDIKFGIVTTVYPRPDGNTAFYLKRWEDSIRSQTYQNYKVFLMGDKYGKKLEFEDKIEYEDLYYAYERDKYFGNQLWCCAGNNAGKQGIKKVRKANINYLILLDYDDYWTPDHLQSFVDAGKFDWACTKSKYVNNLIFPKQESDEKIFNFLPKPAGVIKSSVCYNLKSLPFTPRLVFEEEGYDRAGDWDLWNRQKEYIEKHSELKLRSICINKVTCIHDEEGYAQRTFKNPNLLK